MSYHVHIAYLWTDCNNRWLGGWWWSFRPEGGQVSDHSLRLCFNIRNSDNTVFIFRGSQDNFKLCGSGTELASWYWKVAGLIPLVCMSKCPWARNWTPNCSWCAGRHPAWQPPPSVYGWMTLSRFGHKHLPNALNVNVSRVPLNRSKDFTFCSCERTVQRYMVTIIMSSLLKSEDHCHCNLFFSVSDLDSPKSLTACSKGKSGHLFSAGSQLRGGR